MCECGMEQQASCLLKCEESMEGTGAEQLSQAAGCAGESSAIQQAFPPISPQSGRECEARKRESLKRSKKEGFFFFFFLQRAAVRKYQQMPSLKTRGCFLPPLVNVEADT